MFLGIPLESSVGSSKDKSTAGLASGFRWNFFQFDYIAINLPDVLGTVK